MTTTLILIRHGETAYNRERRYQGHKDIPLTAKGKRQAEGIGLKLKNPPLDAIYSSDLQRATSTAAAINSYHSLRVNILPQLREIDFGAWEGKTYDEIQKQWQKLASGWEEEPSKIELPGGETIKHLRTRMRIFTRKILIDHPGQRVAVITHGGPIRLILMDALGLKLDDWWRLITNNGGISIIEYRDKKAEVLLQNDISHLKRVQRKI
jgi:alpha-ribazole phosphatase